MTTHSLVIGLFGFADKATAAARALREMDVPEWMAPIIAASGDQPFERTRALSRQLWDETRHAMMGEVALERQGVPFHSFPIPAVASIALNTSAIYGGQAIGAATGGWMIRSASCDAVLSG